MEFSGRARSWMVLLAFMVVTWGTAVAALVPTAAATDTCPPGQVEDTTTPGFQCVPQCPSGMLIDGVTGVCVAAPGLPPPPLR